MVPTMAIEAFMMTTVLTGSDSDAMRSIYDNFVAAAIKAPGVEIQTTWVEVAAAEVEHQDSTQPLTVNLDSLFRHHDPKEKLASEFLLECDIPNLEMLIERSPSQLQDEYNMLVERGYFAGTNWHDLIMTIQGRLRRLRLSLQPSEGT